MSKQAYDGICSWLTAWGVSAAFPGAVETLLVAAALGFLFLFWRLKNGTAPLPPGPRGVPLLGYLSFLGNDLHKKFADLAETYGPIYKLWLGKKLYVVISSPSLAKQIVRDQDVTFANRDPNIASRILSYGCRDIAFSSPGLYWRNLRKLFVREFMSSQSLSACYGLRRQEIRKTLSDLYKNSGTPIDIGNLAFLLLVNSAMAMFWGGTLKGEESERVKSEFRDRVMELMVLLASPNISDFFPALARLDLQGVQRKAQRVHLWFDNFLNSVIDYANERKANERFKEKEKEVGSNEHRKDLLQLFLDLPMEVQDDLPSINKSEAFKAMLMDVIVGGTDTTATMVEWAMAELLQNKNAMNKVMEELTEVVGKDQTVEEHHLPKLKYLDAVIKEALRLHPALPLLVPRSPPTPCTIGGYTIPKGSIVFLNMGFIHKDPEIWDKPLEFKPERFLEDPNKYDLSGNNFLYMPFGSGRRVCAGLPLAERMLLFVLGSLLHSFEWDLPQGTELEFSDKFGIVVKKMKPLVAIPRPRLSKLELYM